MKAVRLTPERGNAIRQHGIIGGLQQHGARPITPIHRLTALAREVGRLSPDWRNPERFFENRSEIERAMRRLAKQLENH